MLDTFVETLLSWYSQLGMLAAEKFENSKQQKDFVFEKLFDLSEKSDTGTSLKCKPRLYAERHDTLGFGVIENIRFDNISSVSGIFEATCKGLIENLNEMFPCSLLEELGCNRVVCTGSCVLRNPILKRFLAEIFGKRFTVTFKMDNDAAYGAAAFCAKNFSSN